MYSNYRSTQQQGQGVRPIGGSYFRTPPGQRPQRQSFNRQILTSNKSFTSNKPIISKPPLITPTNTVKQSEERASEELTKVSDRTTSEQSSSAKKLDAPKSAASPIVQQNSQSLFSSLDGSTSSNPPQPPSNPPSSDSPPPLPPSAQPASGLPPKDPVESNKKAEPKEDLSWSPPPPEAPQKPLSIPLPSEASQRETQVPFGATLAHKSQYSGIAQSGIKEESTPVNQNEPPFQSQFIKGYQSKNQPKPKTFATPQPVQQRSQKTESYSDSNKQQLQQPETQLAISKPSQPPPAPTPAPQQQQQQQQQQQSTPQQSAPQQQQQQQPVPQQQQQSPQRQQSAPQQQNQSQSQSQSQQQQQQQQGGGSQFMGKKRPPGSFPNKWGKSERFGRRTEPNPSPMQIEYELDPKVDRSILDAEPKDNIKKFTNRCRLFVGGIVNADEKLLKDMFVKFGEISELWLNKEKGFGFVKMDTRANAQRAIDHYNGIERMNSMVRVRFAARSSAIKVSNLGFAATNELLEEGFKTFGEVEHSVVACDERGKTLGWGVIDFAMKKSATLAIARCKEGIFLLCKSPIPVMVTELKDEDLEEGMVEKTMYKNVLYQREREEGPRFAMPGTMEYQMGLKWKGFLEKSRSEKESLEDSIKCERVKLENETEADLIRYLEEQDSLRQQEELRRLEETRRNEETKRQDHFRQQEMIKQETRRRNQSMRMQEDIKWKEESLHREGEIAGATEDRNFNRPFGQSRMSEASYGYSQDYEHGYSNKQQSQEWAPESGASGYQSGQGGRTAQSGYEEYPGYSAPYEQGQQQSGNQYGGDSYNKSLFGSGDQYRGESRGGAGGYGGYSGGNTQSGGNDYREYSSAPGQGGSYAAQTDSSYGYGFPASSSQPQASGDRAWGYGQGTQSTGNKYDGTYGEQYGDDTAGSGGGQDRRRPLSGDDSSAGRMGYPGSEKRRKF